MLSLSTLGRYDLRHALFGPANSCHCTVAWAFWLVLGQLRPGSLRSSYTSAHASCLCKPACTSNTSSHVLKSDWFLFGQFELIFHANVVFTIAPAHVSSDMRWKKSRGRCIMWYRTCIVCHEEALLHTEFAQKYPAHALGGTCQERLHALGGEGSGWGWWRLV